jgi:hypothetical protein
MWPGTVLKSRMTISVAKTISRTRSHFQNLKGQFLNLNLKISGTISNSTFYFVSKQFPGLFNFPAAKTILGSQSQFRNQTRTISKSQKFSLKDILPSFNFQTFTIQTFVHSAIVKKTPHSLLGALQHASAFTGATRVRRRHQPGRCPRPMPQADAQADAPGRCPRPMPRPMPQADAPGRCPGRCPRPMPGQFRCRWTILINNLVYLQSR